MKHLSLVLFIILSVFVLSNCEKKEQDFAAEKDVDVLIETFDDMRQLADLPIDELTNIQKQRIVERLQSLQEPTADETRGNTAGNARIAICGGNIWYPNGNSTPPCDVRQKITFLDEQYQEAVDDANGSVLVYFVFVVRNKITNEEVCEEIVYGGPDIYGFQCDLPTAGEYTMKVTRYVYNFSTGLYTVKNICVSYYDCGI